MGPLAEQEEEGNDRRVVTHTPSGTGREMGPPSVDTPTGTTMSLTTSAKEEAEETEEELEKSSAFRCSGYSTGNGTMLCARNPALVSSAKRLHLLQPRTPLSGDNEGAYYSSFPTKKQFIQIHMPYTSNTTWSSHSIQLQVLFTCVRMTDTVKRV